MASLEELRKRLPSLQGLSDEQAIRYLEQRYEVPAATIARNLGVKLPEPAAPPAPKRSLFAVANDTVIEAANAAAGTAGSIANFVSPGNRFSQGVDEFIREGEASQSDAVKADKARFRERMEGAQGFGDEVAAVGGYIADAPLQALAQAAGSIAVPGAAMKVAGALGGGVKTGLGIGAAIGGAGAGGDAAGTAYELAKQAGATEEEAVAAGRQASVLPSVVGAAGGVVGAERLLAGAGGFRGGLVSRALKTGAVEGAQEGIEEGITQYEGQRAAVPFDPTIDPSKGVAGAAAMGAALGGAAGAGVSLLSGAPTDDQVRREAADLALGDISKAATVDEAVAAFTAATDVPVLPTAPNQPARDARARNVETMAWLRDLEPQDRTTALGLIATLQRPNLPEPTRRAVSAQLDALERKAKTIPTGEASDMLPTPDVTEAADIPAGEATEVEPNLVLDNALLINKDRTFREKQEAIRRKLGKAPGVEATELLPTGDATEVENIPTPDVFEDIPTADAAEVLPTGDAAEVIPAGEVIEEPEALPTGEAIDIEPDQADQDLLLTGDGMPYGTRAGAYVRAKREGLPPEAVVEVPGGWAVKKESEGGPAQPDVPRTAGGTAAAAAGRAPDAVGSGVAVGRVAADAGGQQPASAAGAVERGGQDGAAGDGAGADPALRIKALSAQWADAVARGDLAEAKRLNDAIVEAKKPPAPAPAPQAQASAPAADTREQAIRRAWSAAPRKLNEWTPMSVSVGEGDKRRANDMLVIQRKTRSDGQGDSVLTMRVLRMGKLLASDPAEPLVFTFKLTGENKVEQVGRARVPTPEDIAQWEGAGFTVPGKKAEPVMRPAPDKDDPQFKLKNELRQLQNALDGDMAPQGVPWEKEPRTRAAYERAVADIQRELEAATAESRAPAAPPAPEPAPPAAESAPPPRTPAEPVDTPAPAPQVSTRTPEPPAPAPTNPPAPAAQTRPEELIELRKRASVLKQLLECLG